MSEPLITLRGLSVNYGKRHALQNVSGTFHKGSLTAIAGPNGSGKSSLLKALAGVLRPSAGSISFSDNTRPAMAYLPQLSHMRRDFPMSVEDVVLTGFYPLTGEKPALTRDYTLKTRQAIGEVGLTGLERRPIEGLSGGEFQRMLFARVIIQNAPVILLDEPFSAVDADTTARLIRLLLAWHREGRTIICVLHDLLLIKKYFPESMVLQGKCLGSGHTHTLFEQKLLSFDLDMAEIQTLDDIHPPHSAHHHHNDHDHDHRH